jgi:hypothetical protein
MPPVAAMIEVIDATAQIGLGNGARARTIAKRLAKRGQHSFYAATALRLAAQAERLLGRDDRELLASASSAARQRGGKIDQLAIRALSGEAIDAGNLASAVAWSTGGMWSKD